MIKISALVLFFDTKDIQRMQWCPRKSIRIKSIANYRYMLSRSAQLMNVFTEFFLC